MLSILFYPIRCIINPLHILEYIDARKAPKESSFLLNNHRAYSGLQYIFTIYFIYFYNLFFIYLFYNLDFNSIFFFKKTDFFRCFSGVYRLKIYTVFTIT